MSREPNSGFFRKLFADGSAVRRDFKNLSKVKFTTSVARSIMRATATAGSDCGQAAGTADPELAKRVNFAHSVRGLPIIFDPDKTPPWLRKLVERFPIERINQRFSSPESMDLKKDPYLTGRGEHRNDSQDNFDLVIGELGRELELRAGLVREQWDIRGPGLLASLTRQPGFRSSGGLFEIELVLPLHGGAGGLEDSGKAWMEALLHDVSFQFPETLRVGWLVALLGSGSLDSAVQILVHAAADVDWLSPDPSTEASLRDWLGLAPAVSPKGNQMNAPPRSEG